MMLPPFARQQAYIALWGGEMGGEALRDLLLGAKEVPRRGCGKDGSSGGR